MQKKIGRREKGKKSLNGSSFPLDMGFSLLSMAEFFVFRKIEPCETRDILKQLCSYKGVEIIEGHLMPDHIHMLCRYFSQDVCVKLYRISERKVSAYDFLTKIDDKI